ncbi:phytanoyl-CoA dioxygenase family protein [Myxococcota bacterium]|nr:phytanoyl-CoA dioxygenase family protein [Myxococcota bacterium]
MTVPKIECLDPDAPHEKLIELLDQDGVAIVEGALVPEQLEGLSADLDALVDGTAPGTPDHMEVMQPFYGFDTIRIDGLPGKSATYVDVLQNERLLAVADHYLKPHCLHYLLNTAQLIQIGPGESAQDLHRDDQAWMHHPKHAHVDPFSQPQIEVEVIYALSDFRADNGGTRVVPGSHRWPLDRQPETHEIVSVEMPRGSAVYFLGSTIHGGGANSTTDQSRRGLFTGFVVGWLRTEENFFLSTPIEAVREMPERVQGWLGYDSYLGIGVVNVGSPRALL